MRVKVQKRKTISSIAGQKIDRSFPFFIVMEESGPRAILLFILVSAVVLCRQSALSLGQESLLAEILYCLSGL